MLNLEQIFGSQDFQSEKNEKVIEVANYFQDINNYEKDFIGNVSKKWSERDSNPIMDILFGKMKLICKNKWRYKSIYGMIINYEMYKLLLNHKYISQFKNMYVSKIELLKHILGMSKIYVGESVFIDKYGDLKILWDNNVILFCVDEEFKLYDDNKDKMYLIKYC